jgi:hypothetical protein
LALNAEIVLEVEAVANVTITDPVLFIHNLILITGKVAGRVTDAEVPEVDGEVVILSTKVALEAVTPSRPATLVRVPRELKLVELLYVPLVWKTVALNVHNEDDGEVVVQTGIA